MSPRIYTSEWPESQVLGYFWLMVREDANRLDLLKQLAAVAVKRPDDWSPEAVREDHDATKHHRSANTVDRCFCCRTGDRRLYWHHVIGIANGGSNAPSNKVAICLRCHGDVHPWLHIKAVDPRPRRGGWSSTASLVDGCVETLKVAWGGEK